MNSLWATMPVDVRQLTDEQMANYAWSENEKRRDVTPIERAKAIEKRIADFGWSQQQCADALGISRPVISNALRLLKLPADVQENLASGRITERIAIALIGLYDLPKSLYDKAESEWGATKPSAILKAALEGQATSDSIRDFTQQICTGYGNDLTKAEWPLDEIASARADIDILKSVTCRDCEQRIKDRNICLDRACFEHRTAIRHKDYLQDASQYSGVPVLEDGKDGRYGNDITRLDQWSMTKKGHTEKIIMSDCKNLRLRYRSYTRDGEEYPDQVVGYSKAQIVCQKRNGYCTCLKALESTQAERSEYNPETHEFDREVIPTGLEVSDAPTATELSRVAAEAKQLQKDARQFAKAILPYIGEQIGDALRSGSIKAWHQIAAQIHYKCGQEERSATTIQDAIGSAFAEKALPYEYKAPVEIERAMIKLLEKFGIIADMEHFPGLKTQQDIKMAQLKAEGAAIAAKLEAEGKTLVDLFTEEEQEVDA